MELGQSRHWFFDNELRDLRACELVHRDERS